MIRHTGRNYAPTETRTAPQKAKNRRNYLTFKDVNKPKDQQETFIEKFKPVMQEDITNKVIASTEEYTNLVWDHILDNPFSPLSWVNDHKDDKAEKLNDDTIKDLNHTESAMAFETLYQIQNYDLDDTHNRKTKKEFQAAMRCISHAKEAEYTIQQTREYINNFASLNQKITAMGLAARARVQNIQGLLMSPLAAYLAEHRVKQIQEALAEIDKNDSFVQKHIFIAAAQNIPTADPARQQEAEKHTEALTAFKNHLVTLKKSLESTKLAYKQATTSPSLTTKNELLQKIKQAEEKVTENVSSFKSDKVIDSLQRTISFQRQELDRCYDQANYALEARKQRVIKEAQDLEEAASKAHIIADRDPGKATMADVWTSFRELNKLDFSKEGQTTLEYRPDIPKITVRNLDSRNTKVDESLDTSPLSNTNVVDAKRMRKVTKITNMGTVSFEIDGNTFDNYETLHSTGKDKGRRKGILTIERTHDAKGEPIMDRKIYEFTPLPENLDPEITRDPDSKTVRNRNNKIVQGGITTSIYKFVSNGQHIEVCTEEENDIFTRDRPNSKEKRDEITSRKITRTESTVTKNKDGVEEKTLRVANQTEMREVIDYNNDLVSFQKESFLSYKNVRGQTVKEIREIPMETLSDITIDLTTKNEKMSSETWVEYTKKALPDNPVIYDDEFKTVPLERLKQTDRINLQARRFFLANGRSFSLDSGDPRTPDHTETTIGKNGLVFKMTGPVRNSRINVSMAGNTNLFNQHIRNKEKELFQDSQAALFIRIDCLQQSLQLAKTTSDIEQLEKEFKKAAIYDNELKKNRARAEQKLASVPENKIAAAEYKKDRKTAKEDSQILNAADDYSESTQQIVDAGNIFVKIVHDSIQTLPSDSKQKQELLNTILAADQQGKEHTLSTEDSNKSDNFPRTWSSTSEMLKEYQEKTAELSHFNVDDIVNALTALKRRDNPTKPTTEQMNKIKTTANLLDELRRLSHDESTIEEFPHLLEELQEISKQETALPRQLSKLTASPRHYENENDEPTNLSNQVAASIADLTIHLNNLKLDFTEQSDFKQLSSYVNGLQGLTKKKEALTRQLHTLAVLPNQDQQGITQLAASGEQIVKNVEKFSEEKKKWIEKSIEDLAASKTKVVNKIQTLATQLNENTALRECMGKLAKDSNQMKDLNDLAHQMKDLNDLANYLKQLSDLTKQQVGDNPSHAIQSQANIREMKKIESEIETLAKNMKDVNEDFFENLNKVKHFTKRIAESTSPSHLILSKQLSDSVNKLRNISDTMRLNTQLTQFKTLSDGMVKIKNLTHQAKEIEQLANYVKDKQELTSDSIKDIHKYCETISEHKGFLDHIQKFKELYDDINKAKEYFDTKDTAYSTEIDKLINNEREIENYIDNQLSNEKHPYIKNRLSLIRMLTAAAHNQFADITEDLEVIIDKDQTHPDTKTWLATRKAVESQGGQQVIKGVLSYIKSLIDPGLPTTIDSPASARQALEHYWVEYIRKAALKQVNDNDHKGDNATIKIALQKVEMMMQRKDENIKRAQELLGSEVSPEKAKEILDKMLHDIDDNSLLLPVKPSSLNDSPTNKEAQEDDNHIFDPDILKNKSLEQVSNESEDLAGKDFEYAIKKVNKLIEEMDDPILKEIYKKNAPKMAEVMAKNATELRKQLLEMQNWWQKIPEMEKQQKQQFWMSILEACLYNTMNGQRFMNDGLGKLNNSVLNAIIGKG